MRKYRQNNWGDDYIDKIQLHQNVWLPFQKDRPKRKPCEQAHKNIIHYSYHITEAKGEFEVRNTALSLQYFNTDRSKAVLLLRFLTFSCPCCPYLNFGSPIKWVTCLGIWMTTCLEKSCSFGLLRMPFVKCCQWMFLVIFLLVLRAGYGVYCISSWSLLIFLLCIFHRTRSSLVGKPWKNSMFEMSFFMLSKSPCQTPKQYIIVLVEC